jgi:hypothetical protein
MGCCAFRLAQHSLSLTGRAWAMCAARVTYLAIYSSKDYIWKVVNCIHLYIHPLSYVHRHNMYKDLSFVLYACSVAKFNFFNDEILLS